MLDSWFAGIALGLAVVLAVVRRRDRAASGKLAAEQRQVLGQLVEEVSSLREALVSSGAVERAAKPPPAPAVHTGPAVEARTPDEPPSTKPSPSRKVSASPKSAPRPVSLEDQITRAMKRIERQARVPPEVEARWEARLRALGAELGLVADTEPTDAQLDAMIRELYEAEADVKDARPCGLPPPLEATLSSAVSALPRANDDDAEDGRDTGEDMTKVYSRKPGEADALIPGVEVKPKPATLRPPHRPPRPIGDPLAGVEPERPKSSATRSAEAFRSRPTLPGGIARTDPPDEGDP